MELRIAEVAEILQVRESKVVKYIKKEKLPAQIINHQYYFNKQELKEWIINSRKNISQKFLELKLTETTVSLVSLIEKGGVLSGIPGNNKSEVLANVVSKMSVNLGLDSEAILDALISREKMMPTAIGRGIAVPHPRNPVIASREKECVSLCRLEKPVDFESLDKKPVHTLFVVLSSAPKYHLEILSKITFLCQNKKFVELLESNASDSDLKSFIAEIENQMGDNK